MLDIYTGNFHCHLVSAHLISSCFSTATFRRSGTRWGEPLQAIALVVRGVDNSVEAWNTTATNKMSSKMNKKVAIDVKGIGRRIREIRGFDLTQQEFAQQLGIGQTQLSKYETGQSVPTVELLLQLKSHSGKSIDWILTGEESPHGR